MSTNTVAATTNSKESTKPSPNDPRRDKFVIPYDKENIGKMTADTSGGISEFYQLISMFIGIYAFMMKVSNAVAMHYAL